MYFQYSFFHSDIVENKLFIAFPEDETTEFIWKWKSCQWKMKTKKTIFCFALDASNIFIFMDLLLLAKAPKKESHAKTFCV